MGFLRKLFGGEDTGKNDPMSSKPALYGGDGSTPEKAVVVNCASMEMAQRLIEQFISHRHGEKGQDWHRGIDMFVNTPVTKEYTIRSIGVQLSDSEDTSYFFDISRPMSASKDVAKLMGIWPKEID